MRAPVELTHAILTEPSNIVGAPETPVVVVIDAAMTWGVTYMPQHKATSVISVGGGHVVVKESIEEVRKLLSEALQTKGMNHESTRTNEQNSSSNKQDV